MSSRNFNIILLAALVSVFCYVAHRRTVTALHVGDALALIDDHYVDPIDKNELLIAAMNGMTSKLDEHSGYIPAQEFENFQHNINQEFAGIGIYVEQPPDGPPIRVVTPLVGSPALSAGIMPGDRFLRVDDQDVSSMGLQEVSAKLKGPIGTMVRVTVRRDTADQQQQIDLNIKRETIELESVIGDHRDDQNRWVYRLQDDPSIAYVRLTGFGEKTVTELKHVLTELNDDFQALVFDMRGNGGGLLDTAVEVSDMFLDQGMIVSTRTRGGAMEDSYQAKPGVLVRMDKPMAILIDGQSASASEIVAACLQDNQRAVIVGTRSYGKGTVQNVMPLRYGRSALRLTVARFYRPSGQNLHRSQDATDDQPWGVRPNPGLEVPLDDVIRPQLEKRWREVSYPSLVGTPDRSTDQRAIAETQAAADSLADPDRIGSGMMIDPQLRRAVEHLRNQIVEKITEPAAA